MVRRAQSGSTQQVRTRPGIKLIRINLDIKLIFYICLGVHKYIYLAHSVRSFCCGQAYLGLPNVILNIKSAICQDWIEL